MYSVGYASMSPDLFPRFSISRVVSLCDFFIVFISIFRSWVVLFNSFSCVVVFTCNSLRDFYFLFNGFYLFNCISLRDLFMSFLKSSISFMRCEFKSKSCFSGVLGYPGLAVLGEVGSDDAK